MTIPTNSFWYRTLFPKRYRIIRRYLAITKELEADFPLNCPFGHGCHDNGIAIFLSIGATNLTEHAFNDVCWRIIDDIKDMVISPETYLGFKNIVQMVKTYRVDSWKDPNPLYPMLPDTALYDFLKHCKKNKLTVVPLSAASWEASAFILGLPCASQPDT